MLVGWCSARLLKEVRELKGLLVEHQSYLGTNQDELAEMHITEKQHKNAHTVDSTDTTSAIATTVAKSYGFGEAGPPRSVMYRATTESKLAESSGQFSVEVGEARPLAATTESELAESSGQFFVENGEAWPPKKAKYTVEEMVDVPGPQFHEDIAEISCNVTSSAGPLRKSASLSPNGPGYSNLKVEMGLHFSRCRADDDDLEPLKWK